MQESKMLGLLMVVCTQGCVLKVCWSWKGFMLLGWWDIHQDLTHKQHWELHVHTQQLVRALRHIPAGL
jgi:hypothetical protein